MTFTIRTCGSAPEATHPDQPRPPIFLGQPRPVGGFNFWDRVRWHKLAAKIRESGSRRSSRSTCVYGVRAESTGAPGRSQRRHAAADVEIEGTERTAAYASTQEDASCRSVATWLAPRRLRQLAPRRLGTRKEDDERHGRTKQAPGSRRPTMIRLSHAGSGSGVEEIAAGDCDAVGIRREAPSGRF